MAKKQLDRQKLGALFDKYDFNKDGTIDYKEVKPLLKDIGYTEAAIEACSLDLNFVVQGDKDGDRKLDKEEFLDIMNKLSAIKDTHQGVH